MTVTLNGTNGLTFSDSSTQNTGGYTGFRNRIVNGDMRIDQRNAGASVNVGSSFIFVTDRFCERLASGTGHTSSQSSTAPSGFNKSLQVTIGTGAIAAASQTNTIYHCVEGANIADLNWGTANAKAATLSFWVRSSLAGTFSGAFQNYTNTRSYPFTYTVASTNTWEQKSITVPGETSGVWGSSNDGGITIWFDLGTGSNYQGSAGSWSTSDYRSATGATSIVGTSGATFYITGVQLEKGSVATPFEFRPYGTELALCQRYCYNYGTFLGYSAIGQAVALDGSLYCTTIPLPTIMRASPSMTIIGTNVFANESADFALINNISNIGNNIFLYYANKGTPPTYGILRGGRANPVTNLIFSAEL